MAALLTIEAQNADKIALYLGECRDMGVPVLPPDVNRSEAAFTVTPEGVRYGLSAVKNVGEGAIASMLAARRRLGRIDSLVTLCEEIDLRLVNKRVLESLVKAGAFDSLPAIGQAAPPPRSLRPRLCATIDRAIEHGSRRQRDRDQGQSHLFGGGSDEDAAAGWATADAPPWTEAQQLAFEKEALGLYFSGHPIARFAADLRAAGAKSTAELTVSEASVLVGGIVSALRPLKTRRGDRMAAFMLEDMFGSLEVVVFPETFAKCAALLVDEGMVMARGKLEKDEESARLLATEILPVSQLRETLTREVAIRLAVPPHGRRTFETLAELFIRHRGDRRVTFELEVRNAGGPLRVVAAVDRIRIRPSEGFVQELERICGAGSVSLR
jgi:DNA polymerase-3 subunit alpha